MKRLVMTRGLPASGKTTWAKELGPDWKRVNKDDLREMLDAGRFSRRNERVVLELRDSIIEKALGEGFNVVVDDTNFHPKHEARLREIAASWEVKFEVRDFTDVPVEECIRRDLERPRSVGSRTIRRMYFQYLQPRRESYRGEGSPCVIVDVDGTLALMNGRGPYDTSRYAEDLSNTPVAEIVMQLFLRGYEVVVMSGRDETFRPETEKWLHDHAVPFRELHMRAAGDRRDDATVKEELFDRHVRGRNVRFVLDDRDRVVRMWRRLGLTCLQVADGDF